MLFSKGWQVDNMFLLENSQGKQGKIVKYYGGMQSRILQSTVNKQELTM